MNDEERAVAETAPGIRPDALSELIQELARAPLVEEAWLRPLAPASLPLVATFVAALALTVVLATVSYRVFEQRFLRLKDRFARAAAAPAAALPAVGRASA